DVLGQGVQVRRAVSSGPAAARARHLDLRSGWDQSTAGFPRVRTAQTMRIAMMMSAREVNGAAVHCLLLTRYLANRGHNVLLLYRPGAWIGTQPGLDVVERCETSFARNLGELMGVNERLHAFGAEVIHTHVSSAHSYGAAARLFDTI